MKRFITLLMVFIPLFAAIAGGDWATSAVSISKDGGAAYNYKLNDAGWTDGSWGSNTAFDIYDFGTPTSLVLNGGAGNAWTDDSPGYDATSFVIYYRVYLTDQTPGTWSSITLDNLFYSSGNNRIYDKTNANIDILALAETEGDYTLEVVMSKKQMYGGGEWISMIPGGQGTAYDDATAGYKATFTKAAPATNDYRSKATGNWSDLSTWENSTNNGADWIDATTLPDETASSLNIRADHTITLNENAQIKMLTIAEGAGFVASDATVRTLTVVDGGSITNNGTFTHADGLVAFAGTATLSGTLGFKDVSIAGGVNFGAASTINGTLTVNAGGSAVTNSPIYAASSVLKFNTGGDYSIGDGNKLWTTGATVGSGVPSNVLVSTTTPLNIYQTRYVTGNLTIESGASVVQGNNTFIVQGNFTNAGTYSFVADGAQALIVKGDFINNGTASMSATSGGDIGVEGDFTNNGTFNSNARAVFFKGGNDQNIDGTQTNIDVIIIDKSTGSLNVVTNLISNELNVASGTLNVKPDKQLTVNTTLTNNATITLQSDATGTATILTPASLSGTTGNYYVEQYLTSTTDAGRSWWYIGTPVSGEKTDALSIGANPVTNRMYHYNETVPGYEEITSAVGDLTVGKGYALYLAGAASATYTFSGTLNNGDISLTPTRTGTAASRRGFNLIANPYPSYLNWNLAHQSATNVRPTIWYRTSVVDGEAKTMAFQTYNAEAGVAVPATVSGYIPPMQAFWMRVDADGSNGALSFTNAMRSHRGEAANMLKAPAASERPLIRLFVSNGTNQDELVILSHQDATNGYDPYDSEKMSNNSANIPELYSLIDNEELVINTMNSFVHGLEVDLGFRPGRAGEFSIRAGVIENIGLDIILQDKLSGSSQKLQLDEPYQFSSDATAVADRFSLLFRTPGSTTELIGAESQVSVYSNQNNRITVSTTQLNAQSVVRIYNVSGQVLVTRQLEHALTEIDASLLPGIYLVRVDNGIQTSTHKIVLK